MQCERFRERLNEILDERSLPSSDAEVTRHAASCLCCAEILQITGRMVNAIEQSGGECTPRLAVVPRATSIASFKQLSGAIAVAATLLVSATYWFGATRDDDALSITARTATQTNSALTEDLISDSQSVSFVHQPIIGLTLLSRADWTQTIDEFNMPFGAQASNLDASWFKAVSDGVMPVQQSVNSTFELIRRSVSQVVVSG